LSQPELHSELQCSLGYRETSKREKGKEKKKNTYYFVKAESGINVYKQIIK
jgi:hypothetical protein